MKITLAMVVSVDGYITDGKHGQISTWTSTEDKQHFATLIQRHRVIIMGRKTYGTAKHLMRHSPGKRRLIMTRDPHRYQAESIAGQLEFTSRSPADLVAGLEIDGHTEALLVGGGEINQAFFAAGLIHELILTIEPVILRTGKRLIAPLQHESTRHHLELQEVTQLNTQGTVVMRYTSTLALPVPL